MIETIALIILTTFLICAANKRRKENILKRQQVDRFIRKALKDHEKRKSSNP